MASGQGPQVESRPITSNPRVHSEPRGFPRQKCQLLGHSSTVTARHTPSADESAPRVSVNTSSPHQGSSKASRRWRLVTATPPAQTSLVPPALGIVICFCPACLPKMPPARGQHHGSAQKPPSADTFGHSRATRQETVVVGGCSPSPQQSHSSSRPSIIPGLISFSTALISLAFVVKQNCYQ